MPDDSCGEPCCTPTDRRPPSTNASHRVGKQSRNTGGASPSLLLRRRGPVTLVLGLGLALSLTLFIAARHREWNRIRADLDRAGEGRAVAVQHHLGEHLLELETIAAFYAGSREVTREEFRRFVSPFLAEDRDILAVEWIPRVATSQRAAFEEAAREDGLTGFAITERTDRGEAIPAGQREEYFPVTYVEPSNGNESAMGFDFGSDPIRLEAMARARDADEAAAAAPVTSIQGEPSQLAFSVLIPIYRNGAPTGTVEERRANLLGFAVIVHGLNRFVEDAMTPADADGVDSYVFDVSTPGQERFLYAESANEPSVQAPPNPDEASVRAGLHYAGSLNVAGRTWRLVCTPTEEFIAARRTAQPWIVLAGTLLLAFALLAYLLTVISRAARTRRFAEEQAEARQALEREVHERILAEEALREQTERVGNYLDIAGVILVALDAEGRVTLINRKGCEVLGYEEREILGRNWFDTFLPKARSGQVKGVFAELIRGNVEPVEHFENPVLGRDGTERLIAWHNSVLRDSEAHIVGILSSGEDITERRRAEQALQESEAKFSKAFHASPNLMAITALDEGRIVDANTAFCRLTGYERDKLIGRTTTEMNVWHNPQQRDAMIRAVREEGRVHDLEVKLRTRSGQIRTVLFSGETVTLSNEQYLLTVAMNITERKRAEEALRESEEKYRIVSENIPVAVYAALPDEYSTRLFVTGQIEKLTGYTAAQSIEDPELWARIIHPDDEARVWEKVLEHRRNKTPLNVEYRLITKDGAEKWVLDRATPVLDENGEIGQITGFMEDITERKRAEEALRESESKNRTLLEALPQKIFLKDRNSVYVSCNQNYARDVGINAAEIAGRTDHEFFAKELAEKYRADDARIVESGETEEIDETYVQEGQERTVHTVKLPVRDAEGSVVGLLGIFWDVTDRKRAEEALRQSERRLQTVLATLPVGVIIVDAETHIIADANPMALEMIGAGREAVVNHPCSDYICRAEKGRCPITDLGRTVDNAERELFRADGTAIAVFKTVTRIMLGGREHLLETFVDISSRKQAEEELQAAKERAEQAVSELEAQRLVIEQNANELAQALDEAALLRQIAEEANRLMSNILSSVTSVVIAVDNSGRVTQWNATAEQLFGIPSWQVLGKPFAECEVPWAGSEAADAMAACRHAGKPMRLDEVRFTRLDKSTGLLSLAICPMADEHGAHTGAVLLGEDVTESRKVEKELKESEQRYKTLFDHAGQGILVADLETRRFRYANPAACQMLGYSRDELTGMGVADIHPEKDLPHVTAEFEAQARGEKMLALDIPCRRKDGEMIYANISTTQALIDGAACNVGLFTDITELRRAEEELRRAHKLELVGTLAAGIAHSINTPIQFVSDNTRFLSDSFEQLQQVLDAYNGLKTFLEAEGTAPEALGQVGQVEEKTDLGFLRREIPKAIEQTIEGVERVAEIVGAMQDFSYPDQGKRTLADLNRALESTLTMARNELKYVAEVVTDFDPDLPPVPCYLGSLNQAFLNLLVNAAHAIGDVLGNEARGEGAARGTITVSSRREGNEVVIRIADTGTGIAEDIRDRIFDPFFTTKTVGKGTGQGLAIAHNAVVDKHGGTLTFETQIGKGTTFIVRLPIEAQPSADPVTASTAADGQPDTSWA